MTPNSFPSFKCILLSFFGFVFVVFCSLFVHFGKLRKTIDFRLFDNIILCTSWIGSTLHMLHVNIEKLQKRKIHLTQIELLEKQLEKKNDTNFTHMIHSISFLVSKE